MSLEKYLNKITCADCLDVMRELPDKCVDLVLTDPPYGGSQKNDCNNIKCERTGGWSTKYQGGANAIYNWDVAPTAEVFAEIFRVSKNQIIWGGNYFGLPPTRCFFVWDKLTISESFSMAMCEYAWTNFAGNAKRFEAVPQDKSRFHPTQKPLKLIKWCIAQAEQYTGRDILIFDPYSGSGTTAVACHELGRQFICVEKDPEYHRLSVDRLEHARRQELLPLENGSSK